MTIEAQARLAGYSALALLTWAAIMLALPFTGAPGRNVAVVGPVQSVIASGGRIVEVRRGTLIARGEDAGFAARLYAHGARLVLEGRAGSGCFSGAQVNAGA